MASDCIGLGATACSGNMLGSQRISWDGWMGEDNGDYGDDGGGRREEEEEEEEEGNHHGGSLVGDLTTPLGTFVIACPGQERLGMMMMVWEVGFGWLWLIGWDFLG